jgi:hypothetical protein
MHAQAITPIPSKEMVRLYTLLPKTCSLPSNRVSLHNAKRLGSFFNCSKSTRTFQFCSRPSCSAERTLARIWGPIRG